MKVQRTRARSFNGVIDLFETYPYNVLYDLWRWKFSTATALALKFWPELTAKGSYSKLLHLSQKKGLIRFIRLSVYEKRSVVELTREGYDCIYPLLGCVSWRFPRKTVKLET